MSRRFCPADYTHAPAAPRAAAAMRWAGLWLSLVWSLAAASGCNGCSDDTLAVLAKAQGAVQWQRGARAETWQAAPEQQAFRVGDGLRTAANAQADLDVMPDGHMRVAEKTVIRFLDTLPERPKRIQVDHGNVALETTTEAIEISTAQGIARVSKGAKVRITALGDRAQFVVEVGSIEAVDDGQVARAGQQLTLEVGNITTEDTAAPDKAAPSTPPPDQTVEARPSGAALPTPPGETAVEGIRFLAPETPVAFIVDGGRVLTVHDPDPPTKVGFTYNSCPGDSILEVKRKSSWSRSAPRLQHAVKVSPGSFQYRLICKKGSQRPNTLSGRLVVRNDPGTRRLPRGAPETTVETDGRKYRVQYQNRLPSVRFTWPQAPKSESYSLEITPAAGGLRRVSADDRAQARLGSGELAEGRYRFRMRTAGGRSSLTSTLQISFDNGARTAFLSAPGNGQFTADSAVRVAGAALSGAKVTAAEKRLRVSRSGRFEGSVHMPVNRTALVVQVDHARSGTHYYLRHPQP